MKLKSGGGYSQLQPVINELISYTRMHFSNEEKLLKTNHCPDFESHARNHIMLLKELIDLKNKAENANAEQFKDLMSMLKLWFPGHILSVDKKHANYLTTP